MSSLVGRAIIVAKTNKSGGALVKGDVVIVDSSNDNAVTTTTSGATTITIGVVVEENGIANNASGRVQFGGHCGLVTPNASVTRGHYAATHTVAKQCTDAGASRVVGTFGIFTTGGTTPEIDLFSQPDASSAAGNMATDALWDAAGDLAVGTGANTGAKLTLGTTRKLVQSNGSTAVYGYLPFIGCKAIPNAGTTMTTGSTEYPIAFAGTDEYDTDSIHDPSSSNTRLTIPSGLNGYWKFEGFVYIPITAGTSNWVDLKIRKNGAAGTVLGQVRFQVAGDGNPITPVYTPPVAVVATDYVELYAMTNVASRTSDATAAYLAGYFVGV